MLKFGSHLPFVTLGAACAASVLAAALPASAQEPKPEFTVIGAGNPHDARRISASVSYRDLDLTTKGGKTQLKSRIRHTASELCAQLGEPNQAVGMAFACEDMAVRDAAPMVRDAISQARLQVAIGAPVTSITLVAAAAPACAQARLQARFVQHRRPGDAG